MKIRVHYTRRGDLKFISHLNTIDLLQRAIFYSDERVLFTEGFNPRPRMSFSNPLPLGVSSDLEIFDIELDGDTNIPSFIFKLNEYLPEEIRVIDAYNAENLDSINKSINYSIYLFYIYTNIKLDLLEIEIGKEFMVNRMKKIKHNRRENVNENIADYVSIISGFKEIKEGLYYIEAQLENSTNKIINPINFIEGLLNKYELDIPLDEIKIHKKDMR